MGRELFKERGFLMVRHDDTKSPHCHFIVEPAARERGKNRLKTDKAFLDEGRSCFAYYCRQQGIDVAASRRSWRGIYKKGNGIYPGAESNRPVSPSKAVLERLAKEAREFETLEREFQKLGNGKGRQVAAILRSHKSKMRSLSRSLKSNEIER